VKIAVRLILIAGAAAVIALLIRDRLATRVARAIVEPTRKLAALAPTIAPVAVSVVAPPAPPPPEPSASHLPILPKPIVKHPHAKAAPSTHHVTRKDVEDAIATKLNGANAVLVRDAEGRPLGLKLTGVSRLAQFGVQDGDVLTSANGYPLRTADESAAALGALKDAKKVTFVLRRGDKSYAVPIELAD
jgi:S1-C subfamily serine protease